MLDSKVTIIIPVYNAEEYLEQCLKSVVDQTYHNLEIICVNDGSTDSSQEILKKYADNDSRIVVLNKINGGSSSARNYALSSNVISGEYVMFLDCDDWIDPNTIEVMHRNAKEYNADAVMCGYVREYSKRSIQTSIFDSDLIVFEGEDVITKFHRRLLGPVKDELKRPDKVDAPISACMQLFKKEIATSSSFVDIDLIGTFEDGLYQIDVYEKCRKVVYVNEYFYHYRKTNSSSITSVYRPCLFDKWNNLYDILFKKVNTYPFNELYKEALESRIALYFAYLCLNEAASSDSFFKKKSRIKTFLKANLYSNALKRLSIKKMPLKWRVFFRLAKMKAAFGLTMIANYANRAKEKLA